MSRRHRHGRYFSRELDKRTGEVTELRTGLHGWLLSMGMDPHQIRINQLWRNWEPIMGSPLGEQAHPLGHRREILLIGVDDPCMHQEISYQVSEILLRANAFMDEEYFTKVEIHQLMGQTTLRRVDIPQIPQLPKPVRPKNLGNLKRENFYSDDAWQCYKDYIACFDENQND